MARIKILIPKSEPIFRTQYQINIGDINYGNHLGNDKVLLVAHEVRLRFLKSKNQNELNFLGKSLIMSDSACIYKMEGFWSQKLFIDLHVDSFTNYGFHFIYSFKTKEHHQLAMLKTGMVFFDYQKRKLEKAPEHLADWFSQQV